MIYNIQYALYNIQYTICNIVQKLMKLRKERSVIY